MSRNRQQRRKSHDGGSQHGPRPASQGRPSRLRTAFLWFFPVLVAVLAWVLYAKAGSPPAAGATVLLGVFAWLGIALSSLGATVPPRDNFRSGSIDFGTRR